MAYYRCMGNGGGSATTEFKYLAYAYQPNWDDGGDTETGSYVPFTITDIGGYEDYLTYVAPSSSYRTGYFEATQDFLVAIIPFVENVQSSGGVPHSIFRVTRDSTRGNIDAEFYCTSNSAGSLGSFFNDNSNAGLNAVYLALKTGDKIMLYATGGTGYPAQRLKLYKVCNMTTDLENLLNSSYLLSNTSTYSSATIPADS